MLAHDMHLILIVSLRKSMYILCSNLGSFVCAGDLF